MAVLCCESSLRINAFHYNPIKIIQKKHLKPNMQVATTCRLCPNNGLPELTQVSERDLNPLPLCTSPLYFKFSMVALSALILWHARLPLHCIFFYCDNNSHYSNNSITADCVYLPLVYEVSFALHSYGNELELGSLKPYQITDIRDNIKNQLVKEK